MKLIRRKSHAAGRRGFSLVEILVVVLIIVILLAIVIGVMGYVNTTKAEKSAAVKVARIEMGMQNYKSDFGKYPDGDGSETSSHTVYMVLFDDMNNDGKPDHGADYVYVEELNPFQDGAKWAENREGKYLIIDPWGAPFRYRLGFQQKDSRGKPGNGVNPGFDFWSIGKDKMTDEHKLDKTGVNEDDIGNF